MLFNVAWLKKPVEVQSQSDLLSTASLVAWLEKQPASATYDYSHPHACLLAKYFRAHGETHRIGEYHIHGGQYGEGGTKIPLAFYEAVTYPPHTYGAALNRLKAFV